jgi:hypothetical protein
VRGVDAQRHGASAARVSTGSATGDDPWTRLAFAEAEMIADSAATVTTMLAAG